MIPSQRSTRRIDFGRGHTPTTQTGIRPETGRTALVRSSRSTSKS